MSWSTEAVERARRIVARYPDPRSAVMPLLHIAQSEEGRLTEEGMRFAAELTGLTPVQVKSVASFYTMFKEEAGRYVVSVCTSISCMLLGAGAVLEAVEEETGVAAGDTGDDGLFTVEHVECIGACGGAPAAQVNYEFVEGLTPESARSLCRWLRDGRPGVVMSDEMQELFGGRPGFPWGPLDREGAVSPVPAFGPYGTSEESR
jgi:NADH-quinone oxidoreductase subunit E